MLNKYLSLAYGVPFGLGNLSSADNRIPSIVYTHEIWSHLNGTFKEKIFGKYIVPDDTLFNRKVVLLYRDPRDVVVFLFFHRLKRMRKKKENLTLMDMVTGKYSAMSLMVRTLNGWRRRLADHPSCLWVSYEDLTNDTRCTFVAVLEHMGFDRIDPSSVSEAIRFGDFENMKKMESEDLFNARILRPGNPADPDSCKVRKGEVGGYVNYFSEDELPLLDRYIADLDRFFPY